MLTFNEVFLGVARVIAKTPYCLSSVLLSRDPDFDSFWDKVLNQGLWDSMREQTKGKLCNDEGRGSKEDVTNLHN